VVLDPDDNPRAFLVTIIAALRHAVGNVPIEKAFEDAEKFVSEAERRYGKIK
jgi:hypothetical protein